MQKNASLLAGFAVSLLGLVLFTAIPAHAETFACNGDPIYGRDLSGRTTVGSRVRSTPCMEDNVLGTLEANALVKIVAEVDGWYKVQAGDKQGWVGARLIRLTSESVATVNEPAKTTDAKKGVQYKKPIGVTETNFLRLKASNAVLLKKLRQTVIQRVQSKGQAYYVQANGVLKQLATEKTLQTYLDLAKQGEITLTGKIDGTAAKLSWQVVGIEAPYGFKVVNAEHANPVYPGDEYHYLSDKGVRADAWENLEPGNTYHFRVCQYLNGSCGVYSNDLTVRIPGTAVKSEETVKEPVVTNNTNGAISLTAVRDGDHTNLAWSLTNMTSSMGFKVVVAEHANPIYPGDDYHYLSSASVRTDAWNDLGSGTHHFRVCEYLGGKCGVYSNDVTVNVP